MFQTNQRVVIIIDSAFETELKTSNTLSEGFIQYKICLANDLDSLFEVLKHRT
jgi:hypothetical protein